MNPKNLFSACLCQLPRPSRSIFFRWGWTPALVVLLSLGMAQAAPVTARYVRVDNPSGPGMSMQEIEIFSSQDNNVAAGRGELVTGTWKVFEGRTPTENRQLVDGDKDTSKRGPAYVTEEHQILGPWVEIDLETEMPIDRIVIYGSSFRQFLDKGDRVVTLLDGQRRVVWASHWNAFDKLNYPEQICDLDVAAKDGSSPMTGQTVPHGDRLQTSMAWLVGEIPAEREPADAEERMQRFNNRFSPEILAELADEFFLMLDPNVPELAQARELYAQKKPAEALDAWKQYWFAKMARENLKKGFHVLPPVYPGQADDLLNGVRIVIGMDGFDAQPKSISASRFTPGRFPWVALSEDDPNKGEILRDAAFLFNVNNLQRPLMLRYDETGDLRYIQRWAELTDDWAMNFAADADATPYNARDYLGNVNAWGKMMEELSEIAGRHPEMIAQIPAATLARLQLRCLEQYGPGSWRQARETAFNHNVSNIQSWGFTVPYIREFRPGQRIEREWRQHMERWMTLFMLPDGSMIEIADEGHFPMPMFLGYNWKWFEEIKPAWFTPGWRNRAWDSLNKNHEYLFRHVAPGGYDHRFDHRLYADRLTDLSHPSYYRTGVSREEYPDRSEIHRIPEIRRILDAVFHVSAGLPEIDHQATSSEKEKHGKQIQNRKTALKILGEDRPGEPKITSDWMPYTGSYYFRSGWAEGNAFLAMLARNSRGGSEPNWSPATWSYGLVYSHDHNFPLMRAETPTIDGLPQNTLGERLSYQPGSKTGSLTYADRDPAQHRWHSSGHFAFGEAVFNGQYRKLDIDYKDWLFGPTSGALKLEDTFFNNVRSNRQIHQLRDYRLFIITDSTYFNNPADAGVAHAFDLDLTLMLSTLKDGGTQPFSSDQLLVNNNQQTLLTKNPDGPNVALYQFSAAPLTYTISPGKDPDYKEHSAALTSNVGIAAQPVTASWEITGGSVLVTLVASSPKGEPGVIQSIQPLPGDRGSVAGFHAKLTDGTEIWYQASSGPAAPLACGPLSMTGESLLVTRKGTDVTGIGIGGSNLRSGTGTLQPPGPDFEFAMAAGRPPTFTPIFRPILNVRYKPDINTFIDSLSVEMTCDTPGVEIHYTTDGTPPTLTSPLYQGPISINESTEFAARAYRLGADGKPLPGEDFEINGTRFTAPSYGWFFKQSLRPAIATPAGAKPGLVRESFSGNWMRLFNAGSWLPASATDVAAREMDLQGVKETQSYGVRFKGYITVPTDGVYTFHAPREYVLPDISASYDLRVYVDKEEWYLTQWWHGHGTWSIPLAKGTHRFEVDFMDARTTPWKKSGLFRLYPREWVIHQGDPSPILISGPGFEKQRIPADWLSH